MQDINKLKQQLIAIAKQYNISSGDYELIRAGNNIVFKNQLNQVIARVAEKPKYLTPFNQRLKMCKYLVDQGAPVITPLYNKAIKINDEYIVTFWPMGDSNNKEFPPSTYANIINQLHQTMPCHNSPQWQPEMNFKKRQLNIQKAKKGKADPKILNQLISIFEKRFQYLEKCYINYSLKPLVVHCDIYSGNIIKLNNQLFLCDLDEVSLGPREIDLATIHLEYRRYLNKNNWNKFIKLYNFDYNNQMLQALIQVIEIGHCLFAASLWSINPASQQATAYMLKTLDKPYCRWPNL